MLASRFVSPVEVAPHVAGAAVDLTLIGENGPFDLGTPIDATPEQSNGACFFDAANISREARTTGPAGRRADRGRAGELPDRVVALVLRRPLLGVLREAAERHLRPAVAPESPADDTLAS